MNSKLNFMLAAVVAAGVAGCKQYSGGTATITPSPLEVRGDSVVFTADIELPADKYKKGMTYVATPELEDVQFTPAHISLDEFPDAANNGARTTVRFSAPYNPEEMNDEMLDIEQQFIMASGKVKDGKDLDNLAACCIQNHGLVMIDGDYIGAGTVGSAEPQKLVSQFNFPQDVFVLDASVLSDEDVKMIRSYLEDPRSAGKIEIHGYASPEGPWERNQMLSQRRAEVVRDLLANKLAAAGYTGDINDRLEIHVNQTIEDWDGFTELVRSNAPDKEDEILLVASGNADPNAKEDELRNITGDIMSLEANLAPLRRATLVVPCKVTCVSPEEVDSMAVAFIEGRASVNDLKQVYTREQWLEAAQATDAPAGKKSLLVAYYNSYPKDYAMYNDLGVSTLLGKIEIKSEDDEFKMETDDMELKVEDDEWKLETAGGLEIKSETDELKIDDGGATAKFEDDQYVVKGDDSKLKVEDDELKMEVATVQVKIEDDHSKLKDGDLKIKITHDENQIKIKDTGFVLKADGQKMKVRQNGVTLRFDDYMNDEVALSYLERYDVQMSMFDEARDLQAEDHVVMTPAGSIYISRSELDSAKAYLAYSLEMEETPQANYNLGVVLALQGYYNDAIHHFNKAGDNPRYMYNRGVAKMMAGDIAGAQSDIRTFLGAYPDQASAYYLMALTEASLDNAEAVTANLQKAAALDASLAQQAENDFAFRNYDLSSLEGFAGAE